MQPKATLRIALAPGFAIGPGKIALLEAIGKTGSITHAARLLAMSYRRAWLLVDDLNRGFKADLVTTSMGGAHGGGAKLTRMGRDVARRYRAIGKTLDKDAEPHLKALAGLVRPSHKTKAGLKPPRPHLGPAWRLAPTRRARGRTKAS
jgi:molybdate transport system regulatory protein